MTGTDATVPAPADCVVGPLLARWARERPDRTFLAFADGSSWSFAEMQARTWRAATGLQQLGVKRGDHVLCWLPNCGENVVTWFAANTLGAVWVPLNTAYRGTLLANAIALSHAEVMVVDAELLPRIDADMTARLRDVIVIGETSNPQTLALRYHGAAALSPGEMLEPLQAVPPVQPWDVNMMIFTSGTTGPSKGVLCTYVQTWAGGAMAMDYFTPDDHLLANLPLFHVSGAGAVMDRLTKGGTCVLYDGFSPGAFWDTVRRFGISGCCLVGAMTQFLLKQPASADDRDHPLRAVITVPWNQDSLAFSKRFGVQMHTAFNMTEIATPIRSEANPSALGTCGTPRVGVEARIVDSHDIEVAPGTVGELILRTSRPWEITQGYYRNPEATAQAWRNGWFHTGDAFYQDERGYLFFVDRMKDTIRRRGENISSFEVESEASAHPAVRESAAIPVPSELGEDEVMLVVSPIPGQSIDPADLLRFLAPRMAHFMLPRYIRVIEALPKTPTAKVEKHRLRSAGVTADSWDREVHGYTVRAGALQTP